MTDLLGFAQSPGGCGSVQLLCAVHRVYIERSVPIGVSVFRH